MIRRFQLPLAVLFLLCFFPVSAYADSSGPEPSGPLSTVSFQQRLNQQVPLDLTFRDDDGSLVRLGDYFGNRPVILTLNYFSCQNLCDIELDDLTNSLTDVSFTMGKDFNVVTVSIDPRDTPDIAYKKKSFFIRRYARDGADTGWHFLTGDESSIHALAQTVGFTYVYDAQNDEYAHPTGAIILTPGGKVSRYLYGFDFPSRDLRLALVEASQGKIGSAVDQLLLVCYHYDPVLGRYSGIALTSVRVASVLTILGLGAFLTAMWRKESKKPAGSKQKESSTGQE